MEMIKRPRGTADIMKPDSDLWVYIENRMRETSKSFGFSEVRTPTFEDISLFQRGVGDTTDVVQKEMYSFTDRDGTVFALRPEGTASVVRAIIENGKTGDVLPLKYYYLINCFRYERPQAGRSREFYQFGTEMFGAPGPEADFEIISLADTIIKGFGLEDVKLHINSIGCKKCRPLYREKLISYFEDREEMLCETCRTRLHNNPFRVLDCKNDSCRKLSEGAPKTIDNLCDECKEHLEKLRTYLDDSDIEYTIDPHIVRGLDYYTRTVFEFISDDIGAQGTICGGGRYDGLMEQLGGPEMAGIGFGMGISRLILSLKKHEELLPEFAGPDLYISPMGDNALKCAARLSCSLRKKGISVETDLVGRSLKAQMKYSNKIGAKYTLIIGDNEIKDNKAQIRNMTDGRQTDVRIDTDDGILSVLSAKEEN